MTSNPSQSVHGVEHILFLTLVQVAIIIVTARNKTGSSVDSASPDVSVNLTSTPRRRRVNPSARSA